MKKIFIILFLLIIGIQFIPVEKTNPAVTHSVNWDSPQTLSFAKRACYDCHSNETVWPWYSHVAPMSWFLVDHVEEGREHLNFSTGNIKEADEAAELVIQEKMPLKSYLIMHSEAKLNEQEKQAFVAGLKKTFGIRSEENNRD